MQTFLPPPAWRPRRWIVQYNEEHQNTVCARSAGGGLRRGPNKLFHAPGVIRLPRIVPARELAAQGPALSSGVLLLLQREQAVGRMRAQPQRYRSARLRRPQPRQRLDQAGVMSMA